MRCLRPYDSCSWQTYVLDVHPFNPRIAMSAGYDGRTIVWDVSFQFVELLKPIIVSATFLFIE